MLSFECDYAEGAHPRLLEALSRTNLEQLPGYGEDFYTKRAKQRIKAACGLGERGEVYLLGGGTQTNQLVISSLLGLCEGVIAADTGHISVHEAGAIEYTGHKVITLPGREGKLEAGQVRQYLAAFHADGTREHMVCPGMVYISYPTEYGTLYSKRELTELHEVCREYDIPLYIDGARLACGLMSAAADVTLSELAGLCDVFYIGGTKNGALLGEAVVFCGRAMPARFVSIVKQHGAMLAKGRVVGVQFDELFADGLYFELGRHAVEMAMRIRELFVGRGYRLFIDSPTNQQFVVLDNAVMERLSDKVAFSVWERYDEGHTVVRFAASWATTQEMVEGLAALL